MSEDLLGKEYISRWTLNAQQHFDDGDYEWLCDLIQQYFPGETCKRILELGCGAGYSTLTFLLRDYRVVSVDTNSTAIANTNALIRKYDYTSKIKTTDDPDFCQEDVLLWQKDLVEEWGLIYALAKQQAALDPIDLIVLCNPGGNLSETISSRELDLLLSGGFSREEVVEHLGLERFNLLHKWALIYASCALSKSTGIPLLIVERETVENVDNTLSQISSDTGMPIAKKSSRPIRPTPNGGTILGNLADATGQLCWDAAVYVPGT